MATEIASLVVTADADVSPAERKLQQLENRFSQTGKQAQQLGVKFVETGKVSNQAAAKLDGTGNAAQQAGNKLDALGNNSTKLSGQLDRAGKSSDGVTKNLKSTSKEAGTTDSAFDKLHTRFNKLSGDFAKGLKLGAVQGLGGSNGLLGTLLSGNPVTGLVSSAVGGTISAITDKIKDLTSKGFEFNSQYRRASLTLATLSGDAKEASKHLEEIRKLGLDRAFEFEPLTSAATKLEIVGIKGDRLIPTMRGITAVTAALGGEVGTLDKIVAAFDQMGDKGEVASRAIMQLEKQGVPALRILSEQTGISVKALSKLANEGKLNGQAAIRLLSQGWENAYGGLADKLATGFNGQMTRFEQLQAQRAGQAVKPLQGEITKRLGQVNNLIAGPVGEGLAQGINTASVQVLSVFDNMLDAMIADVLKYAPKVEEAGEKITGAVGSGIGKAFGKGGFMQGKSPFMPVKFAAQDQFLRSPKNDDDSFTYVQDGKRKRLDDEQITNLRQIVDLGNALGVTTKVLRAAVAAAIVESNLHSKAVGDGGNAFGLFQMWPSKGWGTRSQVLDPQYAIRKFYSVANKRQSNYGDPGSLAQGVEGSAYPLRYSQNMEIADKFIQGMKNLAGAFGGGRVDDIPTAISHSRGGGGGNRRGPYRERQHIEPDYEIDYEIGDDGRTHQVGSPRYRTTGKNGRYGSVPVVTMSADTRYDGQAERDPFVRPGSPLDVRVTNWENEKGKSNDQSPFFAPLSGEDQSFFNILNSSAESDLAGLAEKASGVGQAFKLMDDQLGSFGLGLPPVIHATEQFGDVAQKAFKGSAAAQKENADALLKSTTSIKQRLEDLRSTVPTTKAQFDDFIVGLPASISNAFAKASTSGGGVKGFFRSLGVELGNTLREFLTGVLKNQLNKTLAQAFSSLGGNKSSSSAGQQQGAGSGFDFGSIFGAIKGWFHHGSQSTTPGTSSQQNDTTPGAITQAGIAAVGAVKGAGDANASAVGTTGKATIGGLTNVSQTLLQGLAGIANSIAVGSTGGSFWKGLFAAAATGAISGALGAMKPGGGGDGSSSGNSGDPGHIGNFAVGGIIKGPGTGTSDSILGVDPRTGFPTSWVSNGEYIIKATSVAKIGKPSLDYLNQFGKLPAFAEGGFFSKDSYVPPVESYNTSGKTSGGGAPTINHNYHFAIHTKDAQSFHRSERQIGRDLANVVKHNIGN
jgi:tape measure domain-containing protein